MGYCWGRLDCDRLRPLSYPDSHVILICFSIVSPDSWENIIDWWIDEVDHFAAKVPKILVGCKTDLRYDRKEIEELAKFNTRPITKEQGEALCKRIGAMAYFETSAKTHVGARELFDYAAKVALKEWMPRPKRKGLRGLRSLLSSKEGLVRRGSATRADDGGVCDSEA